jgi:L-threonylcarbamoyladenylate synthase
MKDSWKEVLEILKKGGVGVIPTDTLYGLVGSALLKDTVERIYKIKGRDTIKPFVILITSYKDLNLFGINLDKEQANFFKKIWPGKVSVIFPCKSNKWNYLHRGENSIAFRMIGSNNKNLFNLLKKIGPIVAPSANPQGLKPAQNITQAKDYFNKNVDFYISGSMKNLKPSTLIKYKDGSWITLRKGQVVIK